LTAIAWPTHGIYYIYRVRKKYGNPKKISKNISFTEKWFRQKL